MVDDAKEEALRSGDTAWMLISSALVMLMVPGLALFYGGMVRRKNILATMMQSMVALALIGVFWISIGYSLAFGVSQGGWIGWSPDKLLFLKGVAPDEYLANTHIPIYVHVMFQGMFAIITPASWRPWQSAFVRPIPFPSALGRVHLLPAAHWVWAMNWWDGTPDAGKEAGGPRAGQRRTAGWAPSTSLAAVVHRRDCRAGCNSRLASASAISYVTQPNSMVLTVLGAACSGSAGLASGGSAREATPALRALPGTGRRCCSWPGGWRRVAASR